MNAFMLLVLLLSAVLVINYIVVRVKERPKVTKGWTGYHLANGEYHVMPNNDLVPHFPTDECLCKPETEPVQREDGSMGWVISHNATDGRE